MGMFCNWYFQFNSPWSNVNARRSSKNNFQIVWYVCNYDKPAGWAYLHAFGRWHSAKLWTSYEHTTSVRIKQNSTGRNQTLTKDAVNVVYLFSPTFYLFVILRTHEQQNNPTKYWLFNNCLFVFVFCLFIIFLKLSNSSWLEIFKIMSIIITYNYQRSFLNWKATSAIE